jgi:hypothetical protein
MSAHKPSRQRIRRTHLSFPQPSHSSQPTTKYTQPLITKFCQPKSKAPVVSYYHPDVQSLQHYSNPDVSAPTPVQVDLIHKYPP